jgi:Fur family ferric uptake transcriptional regulator
VKVLDLLSRSHTALSHTNISERLNDSSIDKVTLYRTLDAFTRSGLTHKVASEDRSWLYALHLDENRQPASADDHAHFICDSCEKIFCLPAERVTVLPKIMKQPGFQIRSHEYRLHGFCPDCT